MDQTVITFILVIGAVLASLAIMTGLAGTVQLANRQSHGYLHLIFYAMLLMLALGNLLSERDLTRDAMLFSEPPPVVRHPLLVLAQPLTSLLLLMVACERIINCLISKGKAVNGSAWLVTSYIIFWTGTVAAPAVLGTHPHLSHVYLYPLVIGIAAALANGIEYQLAVKATRNALTLLMGASLLVIPFAPGLVLDQSYSQGLLPDVPRLAGLAAHAVSMGLLALLGVLCLIACPFQKSWLNGLAWTIALSVLFMAQSKAAWISFGLSVLCMVAIRAGPSFWRRVGDPLRPEVGVLSILLFMLAVGASGLLLMFVDIGSKVGGFFDSAVGAQLASLTGRDLIWAIAYEEWEKNPLFGYGPELWDARFRTSIGMPNATHAHNQFMDTLSRSGAVGAIALSLYAMVLLIMSVRYARASAGLSLGLFVALVIRSLSEVPLLLFGYGPELVTHSLLLMTLAAMASRDRATKASSRVKRKVTSPGSAGVRIEPSMSPIRVWR